MAVRTVPRPTDVYSQSLLALDVWDETTLTFGFPTSEGQYSDYGEFGGSPFSSAFNEQQKDAVRAALAEIASFTNLTFVELTGDQAGDATLRFANTDESDTAFAFLPSDDGYGGDAWYGEHDYILAPVVGNYAYQAVLHEIGHALGLLHPHEPEVGPPMPEDRDWMAYTVMTYRSREGEVLGYYNGDWGFVQTYMMEDIAALQHAYGANFTTNSGDTIYSFDPVTGEYFIDGVGQGTPGENVLFVTIWDGGGTDTYDFSQYTNGGRITLEPGEWSLFIHFQQASLGGGGRPPGNIANAQLFDGDQRSLIENVIGGSGDEEIRGNSADNRIEGNGGRDEIWGFAGADILIGGDGNDQIYGGDGDDYIDVGDGSNLATGDAGNDILIGGPGENTLGGGDGNDILQGGTGFNLLSGGPGNDQIFGSNRGNRLYGDDGDDLIYAGSGDDDIGGGAGSDYIEGGDGNDKIDGGEGADTMIGGKGDDEYVVDNINDVVVELENGGHDTIKTYFDYVVSDNIESAWLLGDVAVTLTGDSTGNRLYGNNNDNIIDGGAGIDWMSGGFGDDTYYVDNSEDEVHELDGRGTDTVYASASFTLAHGIPVQGDPYAGASVRRPTPPSFVETLILVGTADINATGNELANTLVGNEGANILYGMEGDDLLEGGAGLDSFYGGTGTDTIIFAGKSNDYTIEQQSHHTYLVSGGDGAEILSSIEFAKFDDKTIALSSSEGEVVDFDPDDPSEYQSAMQNIRDYDGNDLGGNGSWILIGSADVDGDGDIDQVLVNAEIGRFATIGGSYDGLTYFDDHGQGGETRVVGIYIDPLVLSGEVEAFSDFDSQRRFQNDLFIENINRVLGADDYDGDGLQEVYFALTDGTAYLHAYMHADGNIQYANYQSEAQVIDYLESHGFGPETYGGWFA